LERLMLDLDLIRIDGGTQARAALNPDTVADYADAYRAGANMPAIVVFYDGSHYWLADGFHRYFGAQEAGKATIFEEVRPGTQREAVLYSLGANSRHGLQRTKEDKRRAVETLLNDPEWSTWSQEKIAKACGVSTGYVSKLINDASLHGEEIKPAVRTVERNGTTYQQNTANIGKREPDPATSKPWPTSKPPAAPEPSGPPQQNRMPADLETAMDDLEQSKEVVNALSERNNELENEIKTLRLAVDPKVFARIKELQGQIKVIEGQRNDWQNQCNELKKQVKQLQRQVAKANA
jgi:hypothetical protein